MTIRSGALVAVVVFCSALGASAHHGQAGLFDVNRTIELKGTVKLWRFSNPHPILVLEVPDEKGARIDWDVYFGPGAVSSLRRQGFAADTFKAGEALVVIGNPAAAGTPGIDVSSKGTSVTRADGRRVP